MDFHEIYIDGEREECFCDSGMRRRSIPLELHNLECRKWWNPSNTLLEYVESNQILCLCVLCIAQARDVKRKTSGFITCMWVIKRSECNDDSI